MLTPFAFPPHLILLIPSFFSYLYRDRSRLHSFPTRRSSDLRRTRPASSGGAGGGPVRAAAGTCRSRPGGSLGATGRDRKSTRLNSSHVAISYAVFCLKKKRKAPRTRHDA